MRYFTALLIVTLLFSCRQQEKDSGNAKTDTIVLETEKVAPKTTKLDSIRNKINQSSKTASDSVTYVFSLEESNLSLEGNEGRAFYSKGKLQHIEMTFFGETGKAINYYTFENEIVNVTEKSFSYKTNFMEVKSSNDISLAEENHFKLNLSGKLIDGKSDKTIDETFLLIMSYVPLSLF